MNAQQKNAYTGTKIIHATHNGVRLCDGVIPKRIVYTGDPVSCGKCNRRLKFQAWLAAGVARREANEN